ncbi:cysteine desulfurase [Candidatus Woesearchaeota archaeon CG10_big_fil_rev_8_21_14_0_10_34_8]|nr:MAG: cysteine desulfurase [Candidatus Woesearchaeota archaeon CG10_big_fil_rev_8_21_14_0_10_34_8]
MFNTNNIKKDFPILKRKVNNKQLIYLDNAATSQKPLQVINAVANYYKTSNANIHRSIHKLGEEATIIYEEAHKTVAKFINAKSWREIVFTKNTTESLNLIAYSLTCTFNKGDEIIISREEHHSNFVPWQQCAKIHGLKLKIVDIKKDGTIDLDHLKLLLTKKTRLVSVAHISNVLGTVNNIKIIAEIVHKNKSILCVDAAQSVPHMLVDVQDLDCDFICFSGHKMLAPTGIGVLYGKKNLLEKMPPFLFGGGMIKEVKDNESTWTDLPWKFEAGTPNIAGAVGLNAAVKYLQKLGMKNVFRHTSVLTRYALKQLQKQKDIVIYSKNPYTVLSFNIKNIHAHDVVSILDKEGIALRAGHHCAQPLIEYLNTEATVRLSPYIYNTKHDIDILIKALDKVRKVFA